MPLHPFKRLPQSVERNRSDNGLELASIINEEFLNLPTAQQRVRLQAATGDKRFLTLPEEQIHKYIANAINEVVPQGAAHSDIRGSGECSSVIPAVSTLDPAGRLHHVPHDQLPEALDAGHTIAMPMTHPDETHGYVPLRQMHEARERGFAIGHKSAGEGDG